MPTDTGIWEADEAEQYHAFDYYLAKFIGQYLPKNKTIIDFGCGLGSYLKYLNDIGFAKLLGCEGTKLSNTEFTNVFVCDLTRDVNLSADANVICLEVGEHIPEDYLDIFLDNITRPVSKGNKIIISWAVPGQDGIGHVSCRDNAWVIGQLTKRGLRYIFNDSERIRQHISNHCAYFRDTILIFER